MSYKANRPAGSGVSRRQFLSQSLAGVLALSGLTLLGDDLFAGDEPPKKPGSFVMPRRTLGKTGITSSLLGMGTGSMGYGGSSDETRMGHKELVTLLEYGHDRGVRYFDMADQYGSHPMVRDALKENGGTVPRADVVLLTKINMDANYKHGKPIVPNDEYVRRCLDRFRKEVGTDYFDIVLLHHMGLGVATGDWTKKFEPAMDALEKARQAGTIRAHGVSQHDDRGSLKPLELARDTPWVQVDLVRFNPWGGTENEMDGSVEEVSAILKDMKAQGKGLIGMKIFNAGFRNSPGGLTNERKREGLALACATPLLDAFTIGFTSRQQLDEVLGIMGTIVKGSG